MAGIYGLSGSGMDVDALVKQLMTAQKASDAGLTQKQTVLQWKKEAYNKVYDDISNFRNSVFSYKLQGMLNPKEVSSSNTSVATATALGDAANVTHSLEVSQLADGVKLTSGGAISTGSSGVINSQIDNTLNAPFTFTIANGTASKSITIDPSKETMNDLVSKINSSGTNIQASYDTSLDRFFLSTTNTGAATGISFSSITGDPAITGDAANDAILANAAKVNKFISDLKLGGLGAAQPDVPIAGTTTYASAPGKDAQFTLDGTDLTQTSNVFTIASVAYHLTGTTGAQPATSISITNDVDKAVASIKSLVDSYNTILTGMNGKTSEARYAAYTPLTADQKTSMKDEEIKAWNIKAQSGMLHNDTTLNSLVNNMRNAFSNPISGLTGQYSSASAIGITTGNYTEKGKLYLDETKLRKALTSDPNVLNTMFATPGTNIVNTTTIDSNTQGIAGRLYDVLKTTMDNLSKQAGTTTTASSDTSSYLAKQIKAYTTRITAATTRETKMEAAYYKRFNAMETALSKLNTQSTWLVQQFGL